MNRRQPLAIALIWLATVAGASTLTWGVISSTGASVGENVPLSAATIAAPSATPTGAQASASPNSTHAGPSATKKPTTKPSTSPTSTKPTPATKTASWSGAPGKVTASCTGSAVSLGSAIPNDGYRVQTEREGTKLLEVEFEKTGRGEDEDGEVHLKISCTDGAPVFRRD